MYLFLHRRIGTRRAAVVRGVVGGLREPADDKAAIFFRDNVPRHRQHRTGHERGAYRGAETNACR